jgi:hypothetical protein
MSQNGRNCVVLQKLIPSEPGTAKEPGESNEISTIQPPKDSQPEADHEHFELEQVPPQQEGVDMDPVVTDRTSITDSGNN